MVLTNDQIERYKHQIFLPDFGVNGQKRILQKKVLVIGAGGTGMEAAVSLCAAGVGELTVADPETVYPSDLIYMIHCCNEDIGKFRAGIVKEKAYDIRSDSKVHVLNESVTENNIMKMLEKCDFVIEASNDYSTAFLVNDACVISSRPFCHVMVNGLKGQLMTYIPGDGRPCYRCIFRDIPPESRVQSGRPARTIGAFAGMMGNLLAMETIKYLADIGNTLSGYLLTADGLSGDFRKLKLLKKRMDCPVCGNEPTITIPQSEVKNT